MSLPAPADFQPELFNRTRAARNLANEDAVRELCGLLAGRALTAKQIIALRPGWSDRFVRRLASKAGARIVSAPNSHGYCLGSSIGIKPLCAAIHSMESQVRKMLGRRRAYRLLLGLKIAEGKLTSPDQ